METNMNERALGWDDVIEKESDFVVLPAGDYDFTVKQFTRKMYTPKPGAKIDVECPKAELQIELNDGNGNTTLIFHNLILHSKTEGLLSAFFTSIGQKKKGEKVEMKWQQVPTSTGRCKVVVGEYNGNQRNEIKKFYSPDEVNTTQTTTAGGFNF